MPFPISTLLLALALFLIAAAAVALPLFDRKQPVLRPSKLWETLEAERAAIVRAIRELDFDHRTHKIADADYASLRASLSQRGAAVLRDIEAARISSPSDAMDADMERAIAAKRAAPDPAPEAADRACASCGAALRERDRFCPVCGAAVAQ